MTAERRAVRATARFFEDLDRQLGAERGPDGQPSTNDFQVFDLFRIVETFATQFDELPELIPGRADYRIVIGAVGGISHDLRQPVVANGSANGCAQNRLTLATTEQHQTKRRLE